MIDVAEFWETFCIKEFMLLIKSYQKINPIDYWRSVVAQESISNVLVN